jgi:predicted ribosomally synthesized peptide with nif11-like leader
MSKESATEFLLMVASDTALQEKLAVATDPDSFVKIAQESGCSFTTEELFAVISEQNNEELKDEALDAVVGGQSMGRVGPNNLNNINLNRIQTFCWWNNPNHSNRP